MADEKQKIKQAQTLSQTAKNVGDPSNMAKIIGAAGGGLWDFLQQSYEHMVPQTVEDWGLEFSPIGKAIGAGGKLLAGLPFAAYRNKLTKLPGGVGHGTTAVDKIAAQGIDAKKFDTSDILGWMLHAAEDPDYFNTYAEGTAKGIRGSKSGVLPLAPEAKNVLDLVDPDLNDMAGPIGAMDLASRHHILERVKNANKLKRSLLEEAGDRPLTKEEFQMRADGARINTGNKSAHWPKPEQPAPGNSHFTLADDPLIEKLPAATAASHMRLTPGQMATMPHDAIRYHDMDNVSWAFDTNRVPIKTTFGTEIPVTNWKRGPDFLGTPDGGMMAWGYEGLSPDDAASMVNDARAELMHNKRMNKVYKTGREAGFQVDDLINAIGLPPSLDNAEEALYHMPPDSRADVVKAWQWLNPGKSLSPVINSRFGGNAVQALVPTNRMSKIVLDR